VPWCCTRRRCRTLLYRYRLGHRDRTAGEGRYGGRTHARCDAAAGAGAREESAGQDRASDSTRRREGHHHPGRASGVTELTTGGSRSSRSGQCGPCCVGIERRAGGATARRRRRCGCAILGLGGCCRLSGRGGLARGRARRGGGAGALDRTCARAGRGRSGCLGVGCLGVGCPCVGCTGTMFVRRHAARSHRLWLGLRWWRNLGALGSLTAAGSRLAFWAAGGACRWRRVLRRCRGTGCRGWGAEQDPPAERQQRDQEGQPRDRRSLPGGSRRHFFADRDDRLLLHERRGRRVDVGRR
jgi:hypothetical protein